MQKVVFNQPLGSVTIFRAPAQINLVWQAERRGILVVGVGAMELLQRPLVAFFASRQCPGAAIRTATEWALQHVRRRGALIGGFHSPLEQSVLRLALEAGSPVIVVLARPVVGASLRSSWRNALSAGTMAVVSVAAAEDRLTEQTARARNELAAHMADQIVIAHANPDGQLSQQSAGWLAAGLGVERIGLNNEAT